MIKMLQEQMIDLKEEQMPKMDLPYLLDVMEILTGSTDGFLSSLPFSTKDVTAGVENEFQAAVLGEKKDLDLALTIEQSNFYRNMIRRAESGDTSRKKVLALEKYLGQGRDNVWENSWVRFPKRVLSAYATLVFHADLKSDKTRPDSALRTDAGVFAFKKETEDFIRIPVSYLLKLALADILGSDTHVHPFVRITGEKMMAHFLNDNTSPEIFSFYPVRAGSSEGIGGKIARETLVRFLFAQVLLQYSQEKFLLRDHGQEVRVFFSASPPLMQKELNDCISDSFYRDLFMSPCLSGWTKGEEKMEYMRLCHQVLSRSQINGISKLKEAGIITSNLAVLPNNSNISLANNGTHISMGSLKLGRLLADSGSGFCPPHEKHIGDLVIKIVEHFLCLFPGTYSASPCRISFEEFHPEKLLGFLPHELDYTHLRMIWRRWKRKANIRILGQPVTPFGPVGLDRLISKGFFLKGDFIPDARLIDYFVSLMSTDQSPSLDGTQGNGDELKKDLAQMGIFDLQMPLYQMVRLREFSRMGYSGFEHRYYSLFENILSDMAGAADFQNLLTVLAFQYVLSGKIDHSMIPDTPDVESERRQIFFCSAIHVPTFYVKTRTRNHFLLRILSKIQKIRISRRYPGYTRVRLADYKRALVQVIRQDGQGLIEMLNMQAVLSDLDLRIQDPDRFSSCGKLVRGILKDYKQHDPMAVRADLFNKKAEKYYINDQRRNQIAQGLEVLTGEFARMNLWAGFRETVYKEAIHSVIGETDISVFLEQIKPSCRNETLSPQQAAQLIFLMILYVHMEMKHAGK